MDTLKNISLKMILLFLTLGVAVAQERVEIDTLEEFVAIGVYMDDRCEQFEKLTDIDCKDLPIDPGTTGFWTSCANSDCELKIRVGDVVGDKVPIRIEVLTYVTGIASEIRVSAKLKPTDEGYRDLLSVKETGGWIISSVTLDPDLGYTSDSEIYIRFTSGTESSDVDILDQITFVYSEPSSTIPPPLDDVLDIEPPPPIGWITTDCTYRDGTDDYPGECQMNAPGGTGSGFWSSCTKSSCLLRNTGRLTRIFEKLPTSVTINSYVSGNARIEVWALVGVGSVPIGTIRNTQWTDTTFSLLGLGLQLNSQLIFQPNSTAYPDNVDLIDKITVRYSDMSTTTTPAPTTTTLATTTTTPITTPESTPESTQSTTESTQSTPESTTESTQSTPESTTESTQSAPESTIESTQSTPESTTESTQSTPESTTESTQSAPESTIESTQSTSKSTIESTQSTPESTPESTQSTPGSTTESTTESTAESTESTAESTESTAASTTESTAASTTESTPESTESTPESPTESTPESTPESTTESTPESTSQSTPVSIPESTPESTPDSTHGSTPDSTPESTPESTPSSSTEPPTTTTTTVTTTNPGTTTTWPTPTTTTRVPPPNEDFWEGGDPSGGWGTDCEYHDYIEGFPPVCPMNVNAGSRSGFMSSCGSECIMKYTGRVSMKSFEELPTSVIVNSFVSGDAYIEVSVMVGGESRHVGTIKNTSWVNKTYSLLGFGLDSESEILFMPRSTDYPDHVDIIEKITVRFSDPSSTATPRITTTPSIVPPVTEESEDDNLLIILILVAVGVLFIILLASLGFYCCQSQRKQRHRRLSAGSEDSFEERQRQRPTPKFYSTPGKESSHPPPNNLNYFGGPRFPKSPNPTPYPRNPSQYQDPRFPNRDSGHPGSEVKFSRQVR